MTVKIDGTNTVASPAFTGADTDTGLQCGTNEVKLVTGGAARATFDGSGNMGLGTTSPNNQSGYTSLTLSNATNGSIFDLRHNNTALSGGRMVGTANEFGLEARSQNAGSQISFYVNNAYAGRWTTNGLCFNGDTAANNALDDYERGTWTPGGIDNFNGITSAEGQYEKIGNLVNVVFQFNYSSLDSSTSSSGINGLPFPVYDFNSLTGVESTSVIFGTNKHVLAYCNSGSRNIYFDTAKPLYGSTSTGADFFRGNMTYLAG